MGSKKKSKKGGKGKKGKGPSPDAPYTEWVEHVNKDHKEKHEIVWNEPIVEECINSSEEVPRDYLWKYPENPDPDEEEIKYDQVKVKHVLYKKVVCYYFAGLRQDIREGEPQTAPLIEAYNNVKAAGKHVEVVYVSWDKKKDHFDEYFKDMPWYAIPYGDKQIKFLNLKYKVKEVPKLVIVGQDGHVALDDGSKKMMANAAQFPFIKAVADNVVETASKRPNPHPCTVMIQGQPCKCKKFLGSGTGMTAMPDGSTIRIPVSCNECGHADIYHIPERIPKDDKKKDPKKKK